MHKTLTNTIHIQTLLVKYTVHKINNYRYKYRHCSHYKNSGDIAPQWLEHVVYDSSNVRY